MAVLVLSYCLTGTSSHAQSSEFPRLKLVGAPVQTFETSSTQEYEDAGADCFDANGRDISLSVIEGGDTVNFDKPGKYTIKYECISPTSNAEALPLWRTVIIKSPSDVQRQDREEAHVLQMEKQTSNLEMQELKEENSELKEESSMDVRITRKMQQRSGNLRGIKVVKHSHSRQYDDDDIGAP